MPSAGAQIIEMLLSRLSSALTRSRCFSGTSSGMVALNEGVRNACATPHAVAITSTSGNDTCPTAMATPTTSAMAAMKRSQTMMTVLRLRRSATTPPSGASKPTGRKAHTYTTASASGLPVVSVTYHTAA